MRPALVLRPRRQILRKRLAFADILGGRRDIANDPVTPVGEFGIVWGGRVGID